jgi:hypothetical protein
MNTSDSLAMIAESQVGIRGDLQSGRAALYGYLLATDASLSAFDPQWSRSGFGTSRQSPYHLLPTSGEAQPSAKFRLLTPEAMASESPAILRIHSWCAAFVDWCVLQMLLKSPYVTALPLSRRPRTALAFGLLAWGKINGCEVFHGHQVAPRRGDIAVFTFSHTGIVTRTGDGGFHSVEGNTTSGGGGNQGYIVEKRWRAQSLLKGFVRLPEKYPVGDYNVSSASSRTA